MLRLAITLSSGVFAVVAMSTGASAAGRGYAPAGPARVAPMRAPILHPAPGVRPWRGATHRPYGRYRRELGWDGSAYPWPWMDSGYGTTGGVSVIERQAEAPPIDPDSFENLTTRAGIRRSPTPEPTIYRLEGPRSRPVTRVIRIAGSDEPRGVSPRNRFAHAETGALLLTVPGR